MPDRMKTLFASLKKYAPDWDGLPITAEKSVEMMMEVISKVGPEDSGALLSHLGTDRWL